MNCKPILDKLQEHQIGWLQYQTRILGNHFRRYDHKNVTAVHSKIKGFCAGLASCGVISDEEASELASYLNTLATYGKELEYDRA